MGNVPPFDELCKAFFVYLHARAPRGTTRDQILDAARRAADEIRASETRSVAWEDAEPVRITALRSPDMLHRPVRLAAQIVAMQVPHLVEIPDASGNSHPALATTLTLRDATGDTIDTLDVTGDLVTTLADAYHRGKPVEFLGRLLAVVTAYGRMCRQFVVEVAGMRASTTAMDLLGASRSERGWAEEQLELLAQDGVAPMQHLLDQVVTGLGVRGLSERPALERCFRFTVLQAVSGGRIQQTSAKLSGIVCGPPGYGKKLVGRAARALSLREVEASASKISAAGLIGASQRTSDGWRSEPGLLPQADQGVLVLQDAHALTKTQLHGLGPLLQEVHEDGVVRDAKAGGVRREVEVGLLIDLNRASQLQAGGGHGPEAAILQLRPLLSRLDLIAELPADPRRAWDIAKGMYSAQSMTGTSFDEQPWVRSARLLVAALRDRNPVVDLTPVHGLMEQIHDSIAAENAGALATMPEAGDIPARMANSFARFVVASARAHDRGVASAADVEDAVEFLRMKLDFYRLLVPAFEPPVDDRAARTAQYDRFAGKAVRPEDLARAHTEATGEVVSERTVRRDLRRLGAKRIAKGMYLLPPGDPKADKRDG